jgi:hypothetical protein
MFYRHFPGEAQKPALGYYPEERHEAKVFIELQISEILNFAILGQMVNRIRASIQRKPNLNNFQK